MEIPYHIFALGDAAITFDLGNQIDASLNRKILAMQQWFSEYRPVGVKDIVVAYSSITLLYDPFLIGRQFPFRDTAFQTVKEKLEEAWQKADLSTVMDEGAVIEIPVCYAPDFGKDLEFVATQNGLSTDEIILLHLSRIYRVFMIGFLPGFSYMGEIDPRLVIARKRKPAPVTAGSVGIAGSQTGIYPMNCPGGWQIIGRTPVRMFDPTQPVPVRLKIADRVQFYPIDNNAFREFNQTT